MPKKYNKQKGDIGERIATGYLVNRGYKIVKRNFRCREGEIDIIAKKDSTLVFIEVKVKASDFFGTPEEMVDDMKLKRINDVIDCFMSEWRGDSDMDIRIDVIAIELDNENKLKDIRHIENFS